MSDSTAAPPSTRPRTWALSLLMFILGACGLAYEYTFSKIASDLLGNSVQQWATMIATMLFAMGLGAELQKWVKEERLADSLVSSQVVLAVLGGFGPLLMILSFAHLPAQYIIVQYLLALLVGTLIGFEIPLIMRLNDSTEPEMRFNLAQVLKMDYIGALIGALLWTFVMIRTLGIEHISFSLGLATLVAAALSLWMFRRRMHKPRRRLVELGFGLVAIIAGLVSGKGLILHAEQYLYRDPIVHTTTTPYQHIVLTKDRHDTLRCYINGHLQFDSNDEYIYHENLVHPAMHLAASVRSVLILGGGDGLALREVLKYPEVAQVTLVDIDPEMTRLAAVHPDFVSLNGNSLASARVKVHEPAGVSAGDSFTLLEENHRLRPMPVSEPVTEVHILNLDAAAFVRTASGKYDVMILDFPDPSSPDLAKLYSRPFYEMLRLHLNPGGILVQQAGSPVHSKEAFLCLGRTLEASSFSTLPYHDNVPSFGEWGWWLAWAKDGAPPVQQASRLASLDELHAPTRYLTPGLVAASLEFGKDQLVSNQRDITSLTEARIFDYYLQGWRDR
jgi:spermidine synthase